MEDFDTNVELKCISDFGISFNKQNREKSKQSAQDLIDELDYLDLR